MLPQLLMEGTTIDFALIDGWHTFDQVMMEFYYLNRLLAIGGVIAFDDANRRSINRIIRHALTYPAYRVYGTEAKQVNKLSLAGRARKALAIIPGADRMIRPDNDVRSSGWDRTFCLDCRPGSLALVSRVPLSPRFVRMFRL